MALKLGPVPLRRHRNPGGRATREGPHPLNGQYKHRFIRQGAKYTVDLTMPRNSALKPRYILVVTPKMVSVFAEIDLTKWNLSHC